MALQARTETRTTRKMPLRVRTQVRDALTFLTADHRAIKRLFDAYKKLKRARATRGTRAEKGNLAQQICQALTVHTAIEEEIFYPAVRKAIKDNDLMDEAEVEHASMKELVEQLQTMEPGDELYDAKVTVLGDYVALHVAEEENIMFKMAKKTRLNLSALGESLQERKAELMNGGRVPARPRRH